MDTGGVNKKKRTRFVPTYPGALYAIQASKAPARAPPARRKILKLETHFILKILKVFKDFASLAGSQGPCPGPSGEEKNFEIGH